MSKLKLEKLSGNKKLAILLAIIILIITIVGIEIWINNRPLNQVQDAKEESRLASEKRQVIMKVQARLVNVQNEDGTFDLEKINNSLSQIEGIENWKNIESLPATITVNGYKIEINENAEAILVDESNENVISK